MKESVGELNMTLVTIIAIAVVAGFVAIFLPRILESSANKYNEDIENTNVNIPGMQ